MTSINPFVQTGENQHVQIPYLAEVDVPVPQLVEEVVHVPVTQTQARFGPRNRRPCRHRV